MSPRCRAPGTLEDIDDDAAQKVRCNVSNMIGLEFLSSNYRVNGEERLRQRMKLVEDAKMSSPSSPFPCSDLA